MFQTALPCPLIVVLRYNNVFTMSVQTLLTGYTVASPGGMIGSISPTNESTTFLKPSSDINVHPPSEAGIMGKAEEFNGNGEEENDGTAEEMKDTKSMQELQRLSELVEKKLNERKKSAMHKMRTIFSFKRPVPAKRTLPPDLMNRQAQPPSSCWQRFKRVWSVTWWIRRIRRRMRRRRRRQILRIIQMANQPMPPPPPPRNRNHRRSFLAQISSRILRTVGGGASVAPGPPGAIVGPYRPLLQPVVRRNVNFMQPRRTITSMLSPVVSEPPNLLAIHSTLRRRTHILELQELQEQQQIHNSSIQTLASDSPQGVSKVTTGNPNTDPNFNTTD